MTDVGVNPPPPPPAAPNGVANELLNTPPPPPAYYESFADAGNKEWATKSGYKTAEDVAAVARKFDAFKDADPATLARLPAADAKPEEHMKVLERLGLPKDGKEYGLTAIEGVDKTTAEWAESAFQKAGILPWQARVIAAEQMAFMKAGNERLVAEEKASAEREIAQLQSPQGWGADFAANREVARRFFKAAGASEADITYLESGLGVAGVMKLGLFGGKFIKEGEFIDGKPGANPPSLLQRMYPNDVAKDQASKG